MRCKSSADVTDVQMLASQDPLPQELIGRASVIQKDEALQ